MKFGFIGAGNMGGAIIRGFVKNKGVLPENIFVYSLEQDILQNLKNDLNINICSSANDLVNKVDFVILAVKPNVIPIVLKEISASLKQNQVTLVSIAAGVPIQSLSSFANVENLPIIRIMPNINATICMSTSAYCKNAFVSDENLKQVENAFKSIGTFFYVEEEKFSIFSAIAGCAPAYVYLFIDSLAKGAQKAGFNKKDALNIVMDMVKGSAEMLAQSEEHPWALIDKVCSPGGTTIEGICTLEELGFQNALVKAVENSIKKDIELSKK